MSVAVSIISKEGSRPYPLISDVATCKSETGFLLVIPQPPKDNVCKYYIDFLLDMKNDQNLNYFFCHSDQYVCYKLSQIIWKEKNMKVL